MPPKAILSEERIEDSSDESASDSNEDAAPKPTINGHAQSNISKPQNSSDSEDQNSESDTDSSQSQKGSTTGVKRKATSPPKQHSEPSPKRKKTSSGQVRRIEASQYAPPRGYMPVSQETNRHENSADFLHNVEGKQIWHISAPANVPISQIVSIDLQAVLRGGTILEHKGTKYTMKSDDSENANILIPDNIDSAYISRGAKQAKVSRSFQIEEKTKTASSSTKLNNGTSSESNPKDVDNADSTNHTFFATHVGQPKIPRKQPENLKARYTPFGVPTDRLDIAPRQVPLKHPGTTKHNAHQNPDPSALDTDSAMSGIEHDSDSDPDSDPQDTRQKSTKSHSPQFSASASNSSKTPDRTKRNTDGTSTKGSSQPQTPSSTTKQHKEKKKHKRDHSSETGKTVETPVSSMKKTTHQSPIPPASAFSTPVSSGKKKRKVQ